MKFCACMHVRPFGAAVRILSQRFGNGLSVRRRMKRLRLGAGSSLVPSPPVVRVGPGDGLPSPR